MNTPFARGKAPTISAVTRRGEVISTVIGARLNRTIAERRLRNQHITGPGLRRPDDVVAWFGAMQAQEFDPARWAIGLRLRSALGDAEIRHAFDEGRILRTHVLRPTWHFVTPSDIRWLLELTAPRVHRILSYYNRELELDARTLTRATTVLERALGDGQHLTRAELGERLRRANFPCVGNRLARVVMHAELEGVICSGPRRARQFTYALLAHRAPDAERLQRDEALGRLARRFFTSHGPATIRDFVWWSGLTTADAKRGLEMNRASREDVDGLTYWSGGHSARGAVRDQLVHLLPIYDEYLVAYRDRTAVPHRPSKVRSGSSDSVTFQHTLMIGGHVAGTWRISRSPSVTKIRVISFRRLTVTERRSLDAVVQQYQKFVDVPVECSLS